MVQYLVSVLTLAAATAVIVLGLNVRWGLSGQLDLGFYLMVAVGAYVDGVVTLGPSSSQAAETYILGLNLPFLVGILVAAAVCGLLSLVVGAVALRKLRGDRYAIVTVATTIIGYSFISQYTPLFNGYNGIYGVPQPFAGVLPLAPQAFSNFYLAIEVAVVIVVFVLLEMVRRSPFGRAVKAVREDEVAAAAFGKSVYALRLKAYVLGGAIAGIGGSLIVTYISAFNPASWSAIETFLLYGALIAGGTGNNAGAILGTLVVLIGIPQLVQAIPVVGGDANALPAIENILIGLLIIAVLRFRPVGILPERKTMSGQLPRWLLHRTKRTGIAMPRAGKAA